MMKIEKQFTVDVDISPSEIAEAIFDEEALQLVSMIDYAISDWKFTQDMLIRLLGIMVNACDVWDTTAEFTAALEAAYDKFGGDDA
jgi:aminopeptidase C